MTDQTERGALAELLIDIDHEEAWGPEGSMWPSVAASILTAGYLSPAEVEARVREAKAQAWDETITALDAACGGQHLGMLENPYRAVGDGSGQ